MLERKVTISGVVRPVTTRSSPVVTPNVPMDAAGWPVMRQSWRVISTVEVLPFVPVTATQISGNGWKNFAANSAKLRRGSSLEMWTAPSTRTPGRATTATAPAAIAASMKSSPFTFAPSKAPKIVPGATLRWSIAKPVTGVWSSVPRRLPSFIPPPLFLSRSTCADHQAAYLWTGLGRRRAWGQSGKSHWQRRGLPSKQPL